MLKPVSLLALDEPSARLAAAVQQRVAATLRLDDLVQHRELPRGADLAQTIQSIHAQRQSPGSALRDRDDVSTHERVILIAAVSGEARGRLLDVAREIRLLFDTRRLAEYYHLEMLCLLPDLFPAVAKDYGTAYGTLKVLSEAADEKPFNWIWLLDSTNEQRVKFGSLEQALSAYSEAVAGALMFEGEMSGAPAATRPRGMKPAFSSFGFAELSFPREAVLQRVEQRFASELLRDKLLASSPATNAALAAKQFVVGEAFAAPLARIGADSGQSLFRRFQAKTLVNERTRDAESVIAGVRAELKAHRDSTHLQNLDILQKQGEKTIDGSKALVAALVDETLDRDGYGPAIGLLEALLDPMPDLHADANAAPRNLITEINSASAAFDPRLHFTPNTVTSSDMRKRIREIDNLLTDQQLVADTLTPTGAPDRTERDDAERRSGLADRRNGEDDRRAEADRRISADDADAAALAARAEEATRQREAQLAAMKREKRELTLQLPNVLFTEESDNNAARNAARDAEAARLAEMTRAGEQHLRDLVEQRPKVEQTLADVREERRAYIWRSISLAVLGVAATYGIPFALGRLLEVPLLHELAVWGGAHLARVTWAVLIGVSLYGIYATLGYLTAIAPRLRQAEENLQRINAQIDAADKAKNNAHNEELQFEFDVAHRRTTLSVLAQTRIAARKMLDALRSRRKELEELSQSLLARSQAASVTAAGTSVAIIDDGDVDAWYERTADDRKLLVTRFYEDCCTRATSSHRSSTELQQLVESYARGGFEEIRKVTLAQIVAGSPRLASDADITRRLKRLSESSAPLVELRDDDLKAQQCMQRDTTLWIHPADTQFVGLVQRRLVQAHAKPSHDPLRVQVLTRVLHYPAYVLGQIEYYRAQYDPAQDPATANVPDLQPTDLALTGAVRAAYEQVLLGRAIGIIRLREDGQLGHTPASVSDEVVLGDSHLAVAQRLAQSDATVLREQLEDAIAPRLSAGREVERDLRRFLDTATPLSPFDRDVVGALIHRYAAMF